MIPKLYGAELRVKTPVPRPQYVWDEKKFFEEIRTAIPDNTVSMRGFYDFCRGHATISWGTGRNGSFNPKFAAYHPTIAPFSIGISHDFCVHPVPTTIP